MFDDALGLMRRSGSQSGISEAIARFQAEMQRLAFAAVRAVIEQELARRRARSERPARPARPTREARARAAKRRRASPRTRQLELGLTPPQRQLELPLARSAATAATASETQPGPAGGTS